MFIIGHACLIARIGNSFLRAHLHFLCPATFPCKNLWLSTEPEQRATGFSAHCSLFQFCAKERAFQGNEAEQRQNSYDLCLESRRQSENHLDCLDTRQAEVWTNPYPCHLTGLNKLSCIPALPTGSTKVRQLTPLPCFKRDLGQEVIFCVLASGWAALRLLRKQSYFLYLKKKKQHSLPKNHRLHSIVPNSSHGNAYVTHGGLIPLG